MILPEAVGARVTPSQSPGVPLSPPSLHRLPLLSRQPALACMPPLPGSPSFLPGMSALLRFQVQLEAGLLRKHPGRPLPSRQTFAAELNCSQSACLRGCRSWGRARRSCAVGRERPRWCMARGTGSGRTEASVLPVMPWPVPAAPVTAPPGRAPPSTLGQKPLHTLPHVRRVPGPALWPREGVCDLLQPDTPRSFQRFPWVPASLELFSTRLSHWYSNNQKRDGGQSNWKELKRKG